MKLSNTEPLPPTKPQPTVGWVTALFRRYCKGCL